MLELTVVRLISAELTQSGVLLHYRWAFNIPLSAHGDHVSVCQTGRRARGSARHTCQRSAVCCLCGGTDISIDISFKGQINSGQCQSVG